MKKSFIMMWGVGGGYHLLYNTYAGRDVNMAPSDWGLPETSETLELLLYARDTTGLNKEGTVLKETGFSNWDSPNLGATNLFSFTDLGHGYRDSESTIADFIGYKTRSSMLMSEDNTPPGSQAPLTHGNAYDSEKYSYVFQWGSADYRYGNSLRFIYKGTGTPPSTITDFEGNIYDVIQIGLQYWLKQNWKCTKLNNGVDIPLVQDKTSWRALSTMGLCRYYHQ